MTPVPIGSEARFDRIRRVAARAAAIADVLEHLKDTDRGSATTEAIVDVLRLWSELFSNTYVQMDYAGRGVQRDGFWLTDETIAFVESQTEEIGSLITADPDSSSLFIGGSDVEESVSRAAGNLGFVLGKTLRQGRNPMKSHLSGPEQDALSDHVHSVLSAMEGREYQRLIRLTDEAQKAVTKTQEAADVASTAAGKTGDDVMASFYQRMAMKEGGDANTFRRLTVIMSFVAAAGALVFTMGPAAGLTLLDIAPGDYVHLLQRGVFVAGLLGLAGYFARQAHQHRSMANWSGALAVQLQTFEAYLSPIDDSSVKNELRQSFAMRVFGDHPAMKGEPVTPTSSPASQQLLDAAAKAIGRQT